MFDAIRNNPRIAQIILFILMVPFALFGVDYYFRGSASGDYVATVGGEKISSGQLSRTVAEQQDRLRRALGDGYDPAMFEGPAFRASVLDSLVQQRALLNLATELRLVAPDEQIRDAIARIESFQLDGKFSRQQYEAALRNQNMTPSYFEARMRQDHVVEQVASAYGGASMVSRWAAERFARVAEEKREVSAVPVAVEEYLDKVTIGQDDVKGYYDSRKAEFEVPEQVRVEYILLSAAALATHSVVTDEEIKNYFKENSARYQQPEERQASHILVRVAADAPDADKAAARSKAEDILKRVKAAPDQFAEIARKESEDPGSAGLGGDLGMFGRGNMVKPFEDAVFSMKEGDAVGPVETEFGFHVIKLTGIKQASGMSLDEARASIEQELKRQKAGKRLAEAAEQLSNLAYEHSESLKSASEALKLPIQQSSSWISRQGGAEEARLNNPKLLQALFSESVLSGQHNTEAVEIDPETIIAARVTERKPAAMRPLEEVSAQIEGKLRREKAAEMTREAGKAKLADLQQGKDAGLTWPQPMKVSFNAPQGLSAEVLRAVFRVDPAKLPSFIGVERPDRGYTLVRVGAVEEPQQAAPSRQQEVSDQIREILAEAESAAALASVRQKAEISVRQDALQQQR